MDQVRPLTEGTHDKGGRNHGDSQITERPAAPGAIHPAAGDCEPMLQFFEFEHLPARLAVVSKPFHDLAVSMARDLPRNPERSAALRKLLEAKDCAVRAALYR